MTVDEMRAALRNPDTLDWDTRFDFECALDRIPRRYKHLLLLHFACGYSQRDAMRATGTRGKADIYRAQAALVEEMNREA